jgi:hypothetical protein
MLNKMTIGLLLGLLLVLTRAYGQEDAAGADKALNFPSRLLGRIQHKTTDLEQQLTKQTEKCLQRMARREERMRKAMYRAGDSAAADHLFAHSAAQYAALAQKLRADTGSRKMAITGEYQPYTDSLQGMLAFLQGHGLSAEAVSAPGKSGLGGLPPSMAGQLQASASQLQALQAKLQDADQIKQYIRDRKEQLSQYISQHTHLSSLLGKPCQGMNQDLYYYSQQVRGYKELLNNPDALEQKALSLLGQLPAFQAFMKDNSQLAGLFNLPGNYGSPQGVMGLQTRDQIGQLIQSQVASGGAGGAAALQSNLQSAESQLNTYKAKLSQLGSGSGDIDMPDFKPNDQKTKTFLKRIVYGVNFQTTRTNSYYPTVADLGLSLGYQLGHSNTVGVGFSYKIGLGNGWDHIAFSSQGVGLRAFADIKLKGSFFITTGMEYNYTTPFASLRQIRDPDYWTKSGLIGVSKTVSVKSRVFKQTKLSLLWDFLSYQQVPKTQAILFRVGYNF